VALAAAAALTTFDSPLGRPLLEQLDNTVPSWERAPLAEALRRAREIEALPPANGTVRVFDVEQGLATLDLPRAYVGMAATVQRDGQSVAELRVIRRFSNQPVVVAELVGAPTGAPPQPGDAVLAH
jgi:hypothetical protein